MKHLATSTATFVDALRERAATEPDGEAFTFIDHDESEQGRLSFGELDRRARTIAAGLQALDLGGERALLAHPPGLDCVAGIFGCIYAGVVAVPCPPPDPGREYAAPRIREIVADARPRAVITDTATEPGLSEVLADSGAQFIATDSDDFAAGGDWREPGTRGDDLVLVQYTSGRRVSRRTSRTLTAIVAANVRLDGPSSAAGPPLPRLSSELPQFGD